LSDVTHWKFSAAVLLAIFVTLSFFAYRESERQKEIAALEAQVYRLSELLSEQRAATRDNVQRKQARTDGERDEDDDAMAEPASDDSDVDDDNDVPYNPKNLPLGWDGKVSSEKPHYWMYLQAV